MVRQHFHPPPPRGPVCPRRPAVRCLGLALLLVPVPAPAQVLPDTATVDDVLERTLEDVDPEAGDPEQLAETLVRLAETPLDPNTASAEELAYIPAFGPALALAIVRHRERFGPFRTLAALQRVEGVTETVLAAARPYLALGTSPTRDPPRKLLGGLRYEILQRITRRLDLGRGFDRDTTRTTYRGSPERLYTRFRARNRRLGLNLTLEKDPGEAFEWNPATRTYGYDHVSGHLALTGLGPLHTLIVGDFTADFGQGVVLWRSFAPGKGREAVQAGTRLGPGLRPYGSAEENRFFRGLAVAVRPVPSLTVSGFVSRRRVDATVALPDTASPAAVVAGISTSGLHRTPTELARKGTLQETVAGGDATLRLGPARLGVTGYHATFDPPLRPEAAPYRHFDLRGRRASMLGLHGLVPLAAGLTLFGEMARAPGGVPGGLGGLHARLSDRAAVVALARHFPKDFVSPYGFAFGERHGATRNETGFYLGVQLHPHRHWRLAGYVDQYHFPWLRFGVPRPTAGYEVRLVAEYHPRWWLYAYVQARTETDEDGVPATDAGGRLLDAVRPATRQSLRLHGDYAFSRTLRLRARAEVTRAFLAGGSATHGVLLYQDVQWHLHPRLRLDTRLAFFDTDDFETRVFAYEHDLRYTLHVPAFSGQGQRFYVLATLLPASHFSIQIKYAATHFENVETVGTGLDETTGNRLRELRFQIHWRF